MGENKALQAEPDEAALIRSIYKIALEPQSYNDFMGDWSKLVDESLTSLDTFKGSVQKAHPHVDMVSLSQHFETGFKLLEEMGRNQSTDLFETASNDAGQPRILLDRDLRVVWFNGIAARLFGLSKGSHAKKMPLNPQDMAKLTEHALGVGQGQGILLLRLNSMGAGRAYFMVVTPRKDREGQPHFLITNAMPGWHKGVGATLQDVFGFTDAEVDIAELIVEGHGTAEIASHRNVSVNTVRTQLKAINKKSGTNSQTEFMRLLMSLIRLAEKEGTAPASRAKSATHLFQYQNRRVAFHEHGPKGGRPVLFFHGMLDGCSISSKINDLLEQHNIQLICPERPSFGCSDPDTGPLAGLPHRTGVMAAALLDFLGHDRAAVIGHMAGSLYAFEAAAALGARCHGVVTVAGVVPLVSSGQIRAMSRRQRIVAYTARYTPRLLPFILRAGIRQLDFGGERSFLDALYEESPDDRQVLENPEVYRIMCSGYHFTVEQGQKAFANDAHHFARDWSDRVEASSCPVEIIHGALDPAVNAASVMAFSDRFSNRTYLNMVEDTGQLVLFKEPETVFEALERVLHKTAV